ncbi:DUF6705 family protein [Psychroserpens sp. MEBiC05023]
MKKFIILLLAISSILSCKAQTLIKSLDGDGSCPPYDTNCYEKDINNEFNKFEGTWLYQNGTTEITFKLKKEAHYQLSNESNYQDLLVGEYKYIENGVEKVNTLSDFDSAQLSGYDHKISGGIFIHRLPNHCTDNSNVTETKIELFIIHPTEEDTEGIVILRHVNDNGTQKLQACIYDDTTMGPNPNARIDIPNGYYVFVKQ